MSVDRTYLFNFCCEILLGKKGVRARIDLRVGKESKLMCIKIMLTNMLFVFTEDQMEKAVQQCLLTAAHQFDIISQKKMLRVRSFCLSLETELDFRNVETG